MPKENRLAWFFAVSLLLMPLNAVLGQSKLGGKPDTKADAKTDKTGKSSNRKAVGYYADAANFQNNGVFPLAIDEWKKLLKEFPADPLASKAWHYLGVCYMQLEQPDFESAEKAFSEALKDSKLDIREESLVQLSWCILSRARAEEAGSKKQTSMLQSARERLTEFLKLYGDGAYADQARFYLGEVEYSLGARDKAIGHYEAMLKSKAAAKSSLRPDAQYALGVAFEEGQQMPAAAAIYREFLAEHKEHRLRNEVQMRLSDALIAQQKFDEAARLLGDLANNKDNDMADYALLRWGFALSQQNKTEEASQKFERLITQFPNSKHIPVATLSAGQAFFKAGRWDDAAKKFGSLLTNPETRSAEAAHWMAITLSRHGKAKEAIPILESALTWAKDSPMAVALQMDYADALYEQPDQVEKARKAYELIATEYPNDPLAPRAAYNAAFGALQMQQLDTARKWSETFLSKYPNDPLRNDVAYVAAETLLQQGEHAAAAEAYGKLIQADTKSPSRGMWTLRQSMANYLGGKYPAAVDLLNASLPGFQDARQKAEGQFILGACYLLQEKYDQAIEQFQASHKSSDNWVQADETMLMLAEAYQRKEDPTASKETLQALLKTYPKSRLKPQVEYRLGQLAAQNKEFDEAIDRYRRIISDESAKGFHSFSQYGIAWSLMQQDKYDAARKELEPLLAAGRKDAISQEALLAEGVCLRKLGKPNDALAAIEKFLEAKPTGASLANALYESAMANVDAKQSDKAQAIFERILSEVPDYAAMDKVIYELGWLAEDQSDKGKAAQLFGDLIQKYPNSELVAEAYYHLGQSLYEAKKFGEAAETYGLALSKSKSPELSEKAIYKLGWSYFQQEDYKRAAAQFQKQGKDFPSGKLAVDAYFMQAECSFRQDKFAEAIPAYEVARKALDAAGTNTAASDQVKSLIFLHAGQCHREMKQWTESEKWLREVVTRYPNSPYLAVVTYEMGFCAQQQNKLDDALKLYAEVANKYRNETAARARFMMGEVYFSQRDFAKAIPEFQHVMYGFGDKEAPADIKNWQAKSAFEAARCCEVLIENLKSEAKTKAVAEAQRCYKYIVDRHPAHELSAQAQTRLGELVKIR
jgi:cellulose synthase operon protein C